MSDNENANSGSCDKSECGEKKGCNAIVIDLGSRATKQVERLRKGRGKLMDEVHDALDELAANGQVSKNAQPIIVVVSERGGERLGRMISPASFVPLGTPMMFMPWGKDDDEDEDDDD